MPTRCSAEQRVEDGELRVHAARRASLIEPPDGTGRLRLALTAFRNAMKSAVMRASAGSTVSSASRKDVL